MGAPGTHLCPYATLTGHYNSRDRAPLASLAALGFSPFHGPPPQEEERGEVGEHERGGEGSGAEWCVVVDASGAVRGGRTGVPPWGRRSRAETSMPRTSPSPLRVLYTEPATTTPSTHGE